MDRYPIKAQEIAYRELDGEAIIVNFHNSFFYNFNPVGTFIWERCDGRHTVRHISDDLVKAFEVTPEDAARDSLEFIEGLVAEGLLAWRDGPLVSVQDADA